MSGAKHTPGPWLQSHRQQPRGGYVTQVYDEAGETIANIAWYPVKDATGYSTSREANARLIAAAPEMLEACKAIIATRGGTMALGKDDARVVALKAAIAKAEGRS